MKFIITAGLSDVCDKRILSQTANDSDHTMTLYNEHTQDLVTSSIQNDHINYDYVSDILLLRYCCVSWFASNLPRSCGTDTLCLHNIMYATPKEIFEYSY